MAVKDKINRWYPGSGVTCPVCGEAGTTETTWHLFIDCNFAKNCWTSVGLWNMVDELCYQVDGAQEFFNKVLVTFNRDFCVKFMSITWAIWRNRNMVVWNEKRMTEAEVLYMAGWTITEWQEVRLPSLEKYRAPSCRAWHKPPGGYVKFNIDAGFFEDSLQTSVGLAIRRDDGSFMAAKSLIRDGLLRVEEGEAWGVLEAIKWASELELRNVIFETDAQLVRDAYCSDGSDASVFGDFVKSGRWIMRDYPNFSVKWVCRNSNFLAHAFARAARTYESPHSWDEPPTFVDGLLNWCTSCM